MGIGGSQKGVLRPARGGSYYRSRTSACSGEPRFRPGLFPWLCCTDGGDFPAVHGSTSGPRLGWIVGGGVEYMLAPHWTVKAEYLYPDLGSVTYALPAIVQSTDTGVPFWGRAPRDTSPSPATLREPELTSVSSRECVLATAGSESYRERHRSAVRLAIGRSPAPSSTRRWCRTGSRTSGGTNTVTDSGSRTPFSEPASR
jgi:hypothetical protein